MLTLAGLTGCVSVIDVKLEELRIRDQMIAANKSAVACVGRLANDTTYKALYEKVALDPRKPATSVQLDDPAMPSAAEVQLGMRWFAEDQVCAAQVVQDFGRIDPQLGEIMVETNRDGTDLYQDVLASRLSIGEINMHLQELRSLQTRKVRQWARNLDERLKSLRNEQEAQAAESRRQFKATVGVISQFAAEVLVDAVKVLAARQEALAMAQVRYVSTTPAYQAVRITNTSCVYVNGILQCQQISY